MVLASGAETFKDTSSEWAELLKNIEPSISNTSSFIQRKYNKHCNQYMLDQFLQMPEPAGKWIL
jgi:hypothetical protein